MTTIVKGWRLAFVAAAALVAVAAAEDEERRRALDMDALVITPSRVPQPLREVPTHATVIDGASLRASGAQTVDDALRRIPGFSLFRRSSSLVAQPTTQGVTLRGIAPSGTSRTLVLVDGVPVNDPFGGWIYWSRLPRETIERVEVIRGGSSDAWGNAALGGVIHLVTEEPRERGARLRASGGTRDTYDVEGGIAEVRGPFRLELEGAAFETGGFPIVRSGQRGAVDVDADSEHQAFRGRVGYEIAPGVDVSVRGGFFHEFRGNGTPLTENETDSGDVAATAIVRTAGLGEWRAVGWAQIQTFSATFSSAAPDRSAETPALDQFDVPSTGIGGSLVWSGGAGDAHRLSAGVEVRAADGETNERFRFVDGEFAARREAGSEQILFGAFASDAWTLLPSLTLTVGARVEAWRSSDAFRREQTIATGEVTRDEEFGDEDEVAFNPRIGLVQRASDALSFRAAFYRSFRAPTINEQVRPFRVRNDITEANAALEPERLLGGELGADWAEGPFAARVTGFWNEIEDPIANVTVGFGPGPVAPCGFVPEGGVCRQRRNLGRSRIRGVETEAAWSPLAAWMLSVSYLFDDTEITDAPSGSDLEGKRLAQVPKHQVVGRVEYDDPALARAGLELRWLGDAYEDDLNSLELGDYAVVDLWLARRVIDSVELFVGVENLLDRDFEVARTSDGIVTIGTPRLVHGGIRVRL
jgi:outer membrane receptor protein involved in Fe transport